jgi:hypothetical protein
MTEETVPRSRCRDRSSRFYGRHWLRFASESARPTDHQLGSRPVIDQARFELAMANNVELAYVPTNASWLKPAPTIVHTKSRTRLIPRHIIWRNRDARDKTLRELVKRTNEA